MSRTKTKTTHAANAPAARSAPTEIARLSSEIVRLLKIESDEDTARAERGKRGPDADKARGADCYRGIFTKPELDAARRRDAAEDYMLTLEIKTSGDVADVLTDLAHRIDSNGLAQNDTERLVAMETLQACVAALAANGVPGRLQPVFSSHVLNWVTENDAVTPASQHGSA